MSVKRTFLIIIGILAVIITIFAAYYFLYPHKNFGGMTSYQINKTQKELIEDAERQEIAPEIENEIMDGEKKVILANTGEHILVSADEGFTIKKKKNGFTVARNGKEVLSGEFVDAKDMDIQPSNSHVYVTKISEKTGAHMTSRTMLEWDEIVGFAVRGGDYVTL